DRLIMKALARNPDERFASAQEMRAALEGLIRTKAWEADTLALTSWMREMFAGKLRAQAADVAASGLASLEDFLLTVEEKTSISWMAQPAPGGGEKKTPSTGLPPSRPVSGPHAPTPLPTSAAALYSDGARVAIRCRRCRARRRWRRRRVSPEGSSCRRMRRSRRRRRRRRRA